MPGRSAPLFVQACESWSALLHERNPYDRAIAVDSPLAEGKDATQPCRKDLQGTAAIHNQSFARRHESIRPMRHSQHTDNEILHLLYEADAGISIAEICSTAHISLRTFYRWRRRYGSLTPPALLLMKELQTENRRLRALVGKLSERSHEAVANASSSTRRGPPRPDYGCGPQRSPAKASEQMRGASLGRFASVRCTR
jgi:putative transposase